MKDDKEEDLDVREQLLADPTATERVYENFFGKKGMYKGKGMRKMAGLSKPSKMKTIKMK